jgi:hypothetical protein
MPNKFRFVPRADMLVRIPYSVQFLNQPAPYIGRAKAQLPDGSWGYPATPFPYEVEADSKEGKRLVALVRRDGCLLPFDEETAVACGVKFVAVEWVDGEWMPGKQPAKLKKVANES